MPVAPPPPTSRPPLPAGLSFALLGLLLFGALAAALGLPPREVASRPRERATAAPTVHRDVLTGRRLGTDGRPLPPETGWGSAASPIRLRFVPSSDQAQKGSTVERLLAFLRRRTGYHIEGAVLRSYGLVVEEMAAGQCEIAFLTATSFARAHFATRDDGDSTNDPEAFLQVVRRGSPEFPGSDLSYRGALIVRTDSPLRTLEDLTDDLTVAMGPRTSGASFLLPSSLFRQLGIRPRIARFEGAYPLIVSAVLQGSADIGCVWWSPPSPEIPDNDARQLVRESQPDVFERTRIVGFTSWLPNEPVVARSVVPADLRRVLARALSLYVALLTQSEEGRRELVLVGSPVGYVPATNADFEPLFEVIEQAFADDPEGRSDFMASTK